MDRLFALYFQVKMMYFLKRNHLDYEKTFKDLYNELEKYL